MDSSIFQLVGIVIAVVVAVYASRQANSAREQADQAKDANKILQIEMKQKIIDACVEQNSHKGEWETYLNSLPDLPAEYKEEINKSVRMRLGKKPKQ